MARRTIAIISLFLLGAFYSTNSRALERLTCGDVAGGGATPSGPAAVTLPRSFIINLFVRGTDNRIYENIFNHPNGFQGWAEVPGGGLTPSQPAAVLHGNSVKLFVRGLGPGEIFENDFDNTKTPPWSGWAEVPGGGLALSGPAAVVDGGTLKLFVRGLDSQIWESDFNGKGWAQVPGGFLTISTPAPVVYSGLLKLFARGFNNGVFENDFDNTKTPPWSGWAEVPGGGLTVAGPSGLVHRVSILSTTLKLFVTGLDDGIWENEFNGTGWSGWSEVSDLAATPSAPAALEQSGASPTLFLMTEDQRISVCALLPVAAGTGASGRRRSTP